MLELTSGEGEQALRSLRSPRAASGQPSRSYRPRRPSETLLYRIVEEHLDELVELAADSYAKPLPRYVVDEFRALLKCGRLEHGFLRCRCEGCGHEFLVPFSCGNRGICPSCTARRMTHTAAHLVDRVLPNVPVRQWVLSLPFELRLLAARKPDVLTAMGRIFVQEVFRRLRNSTGLAGSLSGAVSFTHDAAGSLDLNPHHHVPTLDGVFVAGSAAPDAALAFVPASPPTESELWTVAERVHRRAVRWLARRGYFDKRTPADLACDLDGMPALDGLSRFAFSGGGYERLDETGEPQPMGERWIEPRRIGPLTVDCEGFNIDASVRVARDDDVGRERLMRYGGRPAFASDRLSLLDDGRVAYRIRYARRGSTHRVMRPVELLARLAALIPPPRHPLTRYFGVLSSHSKHRSRVIPRLPTARAIRSACAPNHSPTSPANASHPSAPRDQERCAPRVAQRATASNGPGQPVASGSISVIAALAKSPAKAPRPPAGSREELLEVEFNVITSRHLDRLLGGELLATSPRLDWPRLLRRSMAIDPFCCPLCGLRMRPIAEITAPDVIQRILDHLAARGPRAPPGTESPLADAAAPTLH